MWGTGSYLTWEITGLADATTGCVTANTICTESIDIQIDRVEALIITTTAGSKGFLRRTRARITIVRIHTVGVIRTEGTACSTGRTNRIGTNMVTHIGFTEVVGGLDTLADTVTNRGFSR